MYRYRIEIQTSLGVGEYIAHATSTRAAIIWPLKRSQEMQWPKPLLPGEGMSISIDIKNEGTVFSTGRSTWKRMESGGRPGFVKYPVDVAWRISQEIPDGHEILNKKNNYGRSFWMSREELQYKSPILVESIERQIEEEALT